MCLNARAKCSSNCGLNVEFGNSGLGGEYVLSNNDLHERCGVLFPATFQNYRHVGFVKKKKKRNEQKNLSRSLLNC